MAEMKRKNPLKKFRIEKIKSEHQLPGPHSCILVLDGLKPNFNVAKIFRSAQALGCQEVFLVNIPFFDPYPAKGAFKQTKSRSFKTFAEAYEVLFSEGFEVFVMDPNADQSLGVLALPKKSAFVVGHEEFGLSFDSGEFKGLQRLKIAQFGQVQSMNVSIAASLAAFEYNRQHVLSALKSAELASSEVESLGASL